MHDLVIKGNIVTPEAVITQGWVSVSNGRVQSTGSGNAPNALETHDAGEAFVLPGIIDGQTHAGSYAGLAGIGSTTRSAVAGGVTTIVDMPYDNPEPLSTAAHLALKIKAIEEHAHANVALYATIMPDQGLEDIQTLIDGGVVAFKISAFESSPTRFPRIDCALMLDLLEALASTGLPLGLHNEDQEIVRSRVLRAKNAGLDGITAHSFSRPPAAELSSTAQFLELAAGASAHAHIVHLSLPRGFQLVDRYAQEGFRATGELCVHYLWFDPDVDGAELGARMKVNPPIRPGQTQALWNEVMSGRVAFVSSDHSSWPVENKNASSIFDAGAGVPGIETLLPAFYTIAESNGCNAALVTVKQLCERPARFFGLWPQKGGILPEADADITIFETHPTRWNSEKAHDDLQWSPYDGRQFSGRVARTYVGGKLAWDGSEIVNAPGDGQYVKRGATHWFQKDSQS